MVFNDGSFSGSHYAGPMSGDFFAVIPAGGSGTRLWPLSRSQEPKFLLDLLGSGKSLLVDTVERLEPFAPVGRVFVVTGGAHHDAVRKQLPSLPPGNVLVEPSPKNSAGAVGLAAYVLQLSHPDAIVGFFAADHVVAEQDAFRSVVGTAVEAAKSGLMVTIGITPTEPSSAFGYVKKAGLHLGSAAVHHVDEFVEKPSFIDAQRFVASGEYLWNAGIFVGSVASVVAAFDEFAPELAGPLRQIAALLVAGEDIHELWKELPSIAFDYAVAEPAARAGQFLVVPGSFGWRDIGDFAALAQAQQSDESSGVTVVGDSSKVHPHDSTGIVVGSSGRIITLLGVENIVVVDTPDALLITTKEHAQDVKQIVDHLREEGFEDLL